MVPRTELVKVAARADFLMLLVPYSPETHQLIDRKVLAAMKPTAFLINLARGGVLDEAALIEHLHAGKIAGAALDIFSKQPLPPDNPLWRMPNVIITPNVGGRSDKFLAQTLTIIEPNLQAFIDGRLKDMRNIVAALSRRKVLAQICRVSRSIDRDMRRLHHRAPDVLALLDHLAHLVGRRCRADWLRASGCARAYRAA